MTGLEKVGIPGGDHLREALTNCTDPLAAIEEFQTQNGILLPSLKPALPFLDLHGVKRNEFHSSVMEELRERLLQRIAELAKSEDKSKTKQLHELLEKSFPVIQVKALRPVVLCVMQHLPKIKPEYLKTVKEDPVLYKECSTEVKRQIWQDQRTLFGDEVSPLLSQYIDSKEKALFAPENASSSFFLTNPKTRRQNEIVQKLVHMIGKNVKLYDMVLQFLRELFLRSRDTHYCTLRSELLMALHDEDHEAQEICNLDPCHKFTWCLDACIRERFVDSKRARELQGFLDGIRKGSEQVLGDLAMVLSDPFAINTVVVSIMRAVQHNVNTETLPRENADIKLLLRMLSIGLNAWNMIDSQVFKEPKIDGGVLARFLPGIAAMMVDDQLRNVCAKIPDEPTPKMEPPPMSVIGYARGDPVCSSVLVYYILQVGRQKDALGLCRILPGLLQCDVDVVFSNTTLHSIIAVLAQMGEEFGDDVFCNIVLDRFFMSNIYRENVHMHTLRLMWCVHSSMQQPRRDYMMQQMKPGTEHSDSVHKLYEAVQERISSYQPAAPEEAPKMDSPLRAVPPPTPAH